MANGSANSRKGSVGHLLDAFLDHANTRGLAPKTIVGYELLAKQAKAEFGAVDLRKLTAQGSTATTADRSGAVCGERVGHHHAFLRSALRQAVRWGLIARSPADSATPPRLPALSRRCRASFKCEGS